MGRDRLSLFMVRGRGKLGGGRASLGHCQFFPPPPIILSGGGKDNIHFQRLQPTHWLSDHSSNLILKPSKRKLVLGLERSTRRGWIFLHFQHFPWNN